MERNKSKMVVVVTIAAILGIGTYAFANWGGYGMSGWGHHRGGYHMGWGGPGYSYRSDLSEEDYKKLKCWIEVENFTGKTVLSVYQDFHARVFSKNMTQVLSLPTKPFIEQADRNRKYSYQVNFAQALASVKNTIVLLFNRSMETVNRLLHDLLELLSMTVEPVRPGRSYPRNHKKRKNFYLNYKPIG